MKFNVPKFKAVIKDSKKRVICKFMNGRVFITRFPDMDKKTKKLLIELYSEFTEEDTKSLKNFLNFKNDGSEKNKFCS